MTQNEFNFGAQTFLSKVFLSAEKQKITLQKHWNVDHLCFRAATDNEYQKYKSHFAQFSDLLIESPVNGRLISTFKLKQPIKFNHWQIDLLELPAPKKSKPTLTGFEHIEVVVDTNFDELKKHYPRCNFDEAGLCKDFNQELEIVLEGCAIKFHHHSLESVIRLEKNEKIFAVLRNSQVLEHLRPYHPLIAGTFPLGIAVPGSDIDIAIQSKDLENLSAELQKFFGHADRFNSYFSTKNDLKSLVVQFRINDVAFELFAQNRPTVEMNAFRHFQIEERLLKLGGEKLRQKVISKRQAGQKTEPAFAQVLDLSGDPYFALLDLHLKSESELLKIIDRLS